MAYFDLNCVFLPCFDDEGRLEEEQILQELEDDILEWFRYCRITDINVAAYYSKQRIQISIFPFARNGHMIMLDAMKYSPKKCYAEFRMYPATLRTLAHILHDEFGLRSGQYIDIYEQVGMFLCILGHGKGYGQIQTLFNHSLETIGHYFKIVLGAVVELSKRLLKPAPNYNHGAKHHVPNINKHPLFENCVGVIGGTHVATVLSWVGTAHDAPILAWSIHSPEIDFLHPSPGKYYLIDSGFAHRPGYMAPYKGSDILYHFQQFYDGQTGRRRDFQNTREKFNFRHSSYRNVIERAFDVWKSRWKILDRMPSYNFEVQVVVVVASMGIHNFLRRAGVVDEAFKRVETDLDATEAELPNGTEEAVVEMIEPEMQRND